MTSSLRKFTFKKSTSNYWRVEEWSNGNLVVTYTVHKDEAFAKQVALAEAGYDLVEDEERKKVFVKYP